MYLAEQFYRVILKKEPPYYASYSLITIVWKPIRKYLNVVIIPNVPFTNLRVAMYRWIGFNIGKNVFIGMKCYLDDVAVEKLSIGENVTISYGCYFASHGKNQRHMPICIEKGAYIGMRCNLLAGKEGIVVGENSIIGAGSLVNKTIPPNMTAMGIPAKVYSDDA